VAPAKATRPRAWLPWIESLELDYLTFQPSIDRKVVRELTALGFVARPENVVLLGPSGVGKTDLAIALAVKPPFRCGVPARRALWRSWRLSRTWTGRGASTTFTTRPESVQRQAGGEAADPHLQ
jgi:DNA replication protein DnaC